MKIIKLLYLKYTISLIACLLSSFAIFFIFSLISNLNEEYIFKVILNLSILNSLQIITYVPAFILLISIILFSIFLKSRNEILIIRSYLNVNKYIVFFLPIVLIFSIFEVYKNDIMIYLEDSKVKLTQINNKSKTKILINNTGNNKNFIILKNLDINDLTNAEYRSYEIFNNEINFAEFSDKLIFSNNTLILNSYTKYEDDVIKDYRDQKMIYLDLVDLMLESSLVKDISIKKNIKLDTKIINLLIFFIFFFSYIFLNFFNKRFLSSKESLMNPIFISLLMLIYSFIIFNNSLMIYALEFELLASIVIIMIFFKTYLNE